MEYLIGSKFGKVEVTKILGEGGYGYTFIGIDESVQKERIVKIAKRHLTKTIESQVALAGFIKEGIILSRLKHPQIVQILDRGEEYLLQYMVLEKINGFDFQTVIQTLKQKQIELKCNWDEILSPITALAIIVSALRPLAYAHNVKIELPGEDIVEGLAHRDISARNLMLGCGHEHEGKIHLIDFGVAKTNLHSSSTMNTAIIGSVKYMSPMRLMKKKNRDGDSNPFWENFKQTRHDVHAIGCFMYELMHGKHFLDGLDMVESLAAIQDATTYNTIQKECSVFDPSIQKIFQKSMVLPDLKKGKSNYQYQNASEMLLEVEEAFNQISQNADVAQILTEFSKTISNPGLIKIDSSSNSRVAKYSTRKINQTTLIYTQSKNWALKILGIICILGIGIYLFLKLWSPITPLQHPENSIQKENSERTKMTQYLDSLESLEKAKKKLQTNKKYSLPKTPTNMDSSKKITEPNSKTELDLETLKNAQACYQSIVQLIREGQEEVSYTKTQECIQQYPDGAFYLLKATMLAKRNANSEKIPQLVKTALELESKILGKQELQNLAEQLKKN